MSIAHALVNVDTTPVSLTASVADADNPGAAQVRSVILTNVGTASVYVGGPSVTTSNYGFELKTGTQLSIDLGPGDVPYAVGAAAGGQVRVLHAGV